MSQQLPNLGRGFIRPEPRPEVPLDHYSRAAISERLGPRMVVTELIAGWPAIAEHFSRGDLEERARQFAERLLFEAVAGPKDDRE